MTNLVSQIDNVVRWLQNGCDQQSAAVELQSIADQMRAAEPTGYAKCVHSMADAIGVAEEQWMRDGFCAACAWNASRVNRGAGHE